MKGERERERERERESKRVRENIKGRSNTPNIYLTLLTLEVGGSRTYLYLKEAKVTEPNVAYQNNNNLNA